MSNADAAHWANVKEVGAAWGIRALVLLYRIFGRTLLYGVLYPVVLYFFLTNRFARAASLDYLRRLVAFSPQTPIQPTLTTVFRHFLSFAGSIHDRVAAWTGRITLDDLEFTGRETLTALTNRGEGALLVTAHLGSLEVCRAMARLRDDMRLNVLVHTTHAGNLNRVMRTVNASQHVELIDVTQIDPGVAMRLSRKIARGEFVVIAGDRVPVTGTRSIAADFLGSPARFPQGPFILASLLKCSVHTLICLAEGDKFHVYIEHLADRVQLRRGNRELDMHAYVQRYARRLESYCQRAPLQWFNFYPFWDDR